MRKKIAITLLVLVAVYAAFALVAKPAPDHAIYATPARHSVRVIAHQGGEHLYPSNTLTAFEGAAELGVDMLEMDIHSTADDVLVVMHDATVDRTTDGSGALQALTLVEVKTLDAGHYWTDDDGVTYPYRGQDITVPTLEEVFASFPDYPMNIEIKQHTPSIAAPFCELIREYGKQEQVLVASFHKQALDEFRTVCPEVATSTYQDEIVVFYALKTLWLTSVYSPPAQAHQVPEYRSGIHVLTRGFVRGAQARNMKVDAWTINDPNDMRRMINLGVDGIITDRPDLLIEILADTQP